MPHGGITHIDIPVSDLARAAAFYGESFGWQIAEVPGFEGYPMWQAPNKVSGGGLAPRSDGFTQPRSYVEVDSIEATVAKAVASGGTVLMERTPISDTSWWAVLSDPDGNHIGLTRGAPRCRRPEPWSWSQASRHACGPRSLLVPGARHHEGGRRRRAS